MLPNPFFWFGADFGVTKDGSNQVTHWEDQTPSNYDATQPYSLWPVWIDNQINGKPIISHDPAPKYFYLPDALASAMSGVDLPISVFMVIKPNTGSGAGNAVDFGLGNQPSSTQWQTFGTTDYGRAVRMYKVDNAGGFSGETWSNVLSASAFNLVVWVHDGNTTEVFVNGVSKGSRTMNVGQITLNRARIGALWRGATQMYYSSSHIAEIFACKATVNAADRQKAEQFCNNKYPLY
jgi:hypothetical protein